MTDQPLPLAPEALRERIDAMWGVHIGSQTWVRKADVLAALASTGDAPVNAEPLDVERLAVSMRYVERTMQYAMGVKAPDDGPPDEWYDGYARNVAKHYARLHSPVPDGNGGAVEQYLDALDSPADADPDVLAALAVPDGGSSSQPPEPQSASNPTPTFVGTGTVCAHCGWGVFAHECPGYVGKAAFEAGRATGTVEGWADYTGRDDRLRKAVLDYFDGEPPAIGTREHDIWDALEPDTATCPVCGRIASPNAIALPHVRPDTLLPCVPDGGSSSVTEPES